MTTLEKFQCNNLFLLIGGNPLPNYVAAKLLLKSDQQWNPRLYLLHSPIIRDDSGKEKEPGTEKYAGYLQEVLGKELQNTFGDRVNSDSIKLIPVNESNPQNISTAIQACFTGSGSIQGSVGLNYTGGTKVMAVHAYLTIREMCKNKSDVYFSYLNPREMVMCFDHLPNNPFKLGDPAHSDDREYFQKAEIGLVSLLQLHGLKPLKPTYQERNNFQNPRTEPKLPEIASLLYGLFLDENKWETWHKFTESLSKQPVSLLQFNELADKFKEAGLTNDSGELDQSKHSTGGFPNAREYINWLQGNWLEDYLLKIILELSATNDCALHDCGASLTTGKPNHEKEKYFELDVVALRGYQLFAFSCTTSNSKSKNKQKLFEVYVRARQLGGDESRVGLICRYPNTRELQEEIEQEWSLEKGKIKVFGKNELLNLKNELKKWFNREN